MLLIAVTFLIFANITNHSKGLHNDVKIAFLYIVYLWMILIFSFPGDKVPDMYAYEELYYSNILNSNFEYLFSVVCNAAKSFGLNFNGFLFIFEVLLFGIWFIASKRIFTDVHLIFMVFFPFMGIYNFGIIIRAGMGLVLCYYALTLLINNRSFKGYIIYFAIVTFGFFFHQSMAVFYVLPLYIFRKINSIFLLVLVVTSILIPLFNIQQFIVDLIESFINLFSIKKFESYTQIHANYSLKGVYSLTMIKYFILALVFISLRTKIITGKDLYNCFLNIYVTGVLLIALTHFILAGNRLAYIFFFFEFGLIGVLYEHSTVPKKIVILCAVCLGILNYTNLVSAIPAMITY